MANSAATPHHKPQETSVKMACTLIIRGGEIALHESENFNKVRHRANKAKKMLIDYQNGNIDGTSKGQKFEPSHILTFKTDNETEEGGRISIDIENYIGVLSDEAKDVGQSTGNSHDEEYDDEGDEGEEEEEEEGEE
jgi:hypothetical protein